MCYTCFPYSPPAYKIWLVFLISFFFFKTGSHVLAKGGHSLYRAQADLDLEKSPALAYKCWHYRHVLPYLVEFFLILISLFQVFKL